MRDHILLQSVARANRPYVDANGMQKRVGLVVDVVGVLRALKKALQFDSSDVSGAIEDLDMLLEDFLKRIAQAKQDYLKPDAGGTPDERLERLVFGRFLTPEARKTFFENYKEIKALWEILSPDPALCDHITTYKQLSQLYATVRNAYASKVGFVADLAYKTRRLIEQNAEQHGLGRLTKSVTFDMATLTSLRDEVGSEEGKVYNLVRDLQREIDENPATAPVLQPLKDCADRIIKNLEERKTTGLAAMDQLAALAAEKDAAMQAARNSGLSPRAFAIAWVLREDAAIKALGIDAMTLAKDAEALLGRYRNALMNADEQRRLRVPRCTRPSLLLGRTSGRVSSTSLYGCCWRRAANEIVAISGTRLETSCAVLGGQAQGESSCRSGPGHAQKMGLVLFNGHHHVSERPPRPRAAFSGLRHRP